MLYVQLIKHHQMEQKRTRRTHQHTQRRRTIPIQLGRTILPRLGTHPMEQSHRMEQRTRGANAKHH